MKCCNSGESVSSHGRPAKSCGTDGSDGSQRAQNLQEAPLTGRLVLFQREQLQRTVFCAKAQASYVGNTWPPLTECAAGFKASRNPAREKSGSIGFILHICLLNFKD